MRDFLIVGLTGPTGAGKSTVSKIFEQHGFVIINADQVARDILSIGSTPLKQISIVFGENCINADGTANRKVIAERAFSSKENTKLLNEITHPAIFLKTLEMCRKYIDSGKTKIVFDAPVLFESNSDIMCDVIITVTADKEIRKKRLAVRDNIDVKDVEKRMSAQHDDEYYISRSDFVIDGGKSIHEVEKQAVNIIFSSFFEKKEAKKL